MIKPVQFIRLLKIFYILMRHGINPTVLSSRTRTLRRLSYLNPLHFAEKSKSRGESIRIALERLGPVFVKFGQLLSTRRDLIPSDIINELEKLQDAVPPFEGTIAISIIESAFGKTISELFSSFETKPLASASIAQVHAATLHDGSEVVVKVLRPQIGRVIRHDIAILYQVAKLVERFWKQGKRLHPIDLVTEFEKTILDELDLMREAANASQLRRNFENSEMMYVPQVYWDYTKPSIATFERIRGVPISDLQTLRTKNTNLKLLAEYGVEIFFTQVFRDNFFHADMHPGNLFVDVTNPDHPKYLGVDFGIMGTLSPSDQHYLARNLLAFFKRDYRRVATLHIESGWVPPNTRVDEFESAIRTVCEPIFERPIGEISFAQLLLRLFQTAERFHMEIQPQLMLLQKTLLAIEGLGRQLYPDLNLWNTAKPFMVKWMRKQHSVKKLSKEIFNNWGEASEKILKTPPLFFDLIQNMQRHYQASTVHSWNQTKTQKPKRRLPAFLLGALIGVLIPILYFITKQHIPL